jgi:hypothetical protein
MILYLTYSSKAAMRAGRRRAVKSAAKFTARGLRAVCQTDDTKLERWLGGTVWRRDQAAWNSAQKAWL